MSRLPQRYLQFFQDFPAVGSAYKDLGDAVATAGPLDKKTAELVKIGVALGARMEGAVHSHVRKALEAGATAEEIRHAVLQATTTIGFPNMMAGLSWVDETIAKAQS
ncbi:MAG: carboxymuconolactone decarboxylase family protein [Armatimonadetes bacterium]|nr:carboxymuconolactone decarboxylase family protein [Armatimonadota bacterium]